MEPESTDEGLRKWISVHKPKGDDFDTVTVSFEGQTASSKSSYKFDYCYDQNEGNAMIFSREVNPLIGDVFSGGKAAVCHCLWSKRQWKDFYNTGFGEGTGFSCSSHD
ncbi:hypothetical protein PTKIN_Ptkin13bG0306800 [Pterospermum kingtungense]